MRTFALITLSGLVALNCFLAYSGQFLAEQMGRSYHHLGVKLPGLTYAALVLPPWFYVVALASLAVAGLGFFRRVTDSKLMVGAVCFLTVDVAGLLVSLWGFCVIHIQIGEVLTR
jgi:hypothetical protein